MTAVWPGSCLHGIMGWENPRWEDYDYVMYHRNRFAYYGDGWTEVERNGGDPASYMDNIDYPPVPEDEIDRVTNGSIGFADSAKAKTHHPEGVHLTSPVPSV